MPVAVALGVLVLGGAAGCDTEPQPPDAWPAELGITGSVLLLGSAADDVAARERFEELAGGDTARIAAAGAAASSGSGTTPGEPTPGASSPDPEPARAGGQPPRAAAALATADTVSGDVGEGAAEEERLPTGSWVDGPLEAAGVEALSALLGRGGVVALRAGTAGDAAPRMIPGALVQTGYGPDDRDRLLERLRAEREPIFGIGLPDDAVLEVNHRRMRAVEGVVTLLVPDGEGRPMREETLDAEASPRGRQNLADLTAWRREAIERRLPPFPPAEPEPPHVPSGTLVIVGGGGMPSGLMDDFVEMAGGSEARLIFVPASAADEISSEPGMVRRWREAGVASADWIHTKDRRRADTDEEFLAPLREATGIWFGGGRQWNFSDSYYGTTAHQLMLEVLERGGVIGGSSAGASIQARYMARGDPLGNRNIMAPGYERGLGFITGVAIDQHFAERDRLADMEELVAAYPQLLGIGIDEATAIIVRGSRAEVIGRSEVYFYDRRTDPSAEPVALSEGGVYDLRERRPVGAGSGDPDGDLDAGPDHRPDP